MTTVFITGNGSTTLISLHISNFIAGSTSAYQDSSLAVISTTFTGVSLVEKGANFGDFDANGFAESGKVTEFDLSLNGTPEFQFAGISVSARKLEQILLSGDDDAFNKIIFGGPDYIVTPKGGAAVAGYGGNDVFFASGKGRDFFDGGTGTDNLSGNAGKDTLIGGLGGDVLVGGSAADIFAYRSVAESSAHHADQIIDLRDADQIDLLSIDADSSSPSTDETFHLVHHLNGAAGDLALSYDNHLNRTAIKGDVDGDGHADLVIYVSGNHTDYGNFLF